MSICTDRIYAVRLNMDLMFSEVNGTPALSVCLPLKKTLRYSELRKELGNVTDAVLAAALKSLTENELVSRKII